MCFFASYVLPEYICFMNVALRTRKFETTYPDGENSAPKLTRLGKYVMNSDGSFKMKGGKKILIRFKQLTIQYYLEIYRKGEKRESQFLDIFILPSDTAQQKEDKTALANSIRNKVEQEYAAGKFDNVLPKYRSGIDFFAYCDNYLKEYKNKDNRKVAGSIKHFKRFYETKYNRTTLSMASFKNTVANDFIKYLKKDSGLSGGTPMAYLKKIKAIAKAAHFDRLLNEDPFYLLSTKLLQHKDVIKKEVLTEDELIQLFKTPCSNEFVRRTFFWGCYTGMGMGEIRKLKWSQIKIDAKELRYSRGKTEIKVVLHLNNFTEKLLFGLNKKNTLVFEDYRMPSDNGINKVLGRWVRSAGIDKHITFYCSRHIFGTRVLRTSNNLKVVAETMGHSSTRFTENYARIIDNEDKKAVESLPDISLGTA